MLAMIGIAQKIGIFRNTEDSNLLRLRLQGTSRRYILSKPLVHFIQ